MHTEFLRQATGAHDASCLGSVVFGMAAASTKARNAPVVGGLRLNIVF